MIFQKIHKKNLTSIQKLNSLFSYVYMSIDEFLKKNFRNTPNIKLRKNFKIQLSQFYVAIFRYQLNYFHFIDMASHMDDHTYYFKAK